MTPAPETTAAGNRGAEGTFLPAVLRPGTHDTPDGRVEISTAAFAESVLREVPDQHMVFRMGDVVGRLEGGASPRHFTPLDGDQTRLLIDRAVRITAARKAQEPGSLGIVYVPCTADLARLVLAAARSATTVRELTLVATHPVYLPGLVLAAPGYDGRSQVFYDEPEELRGLEPMREGALAVLDDVLAGFRFKAEADQENAIAYMVTRVVRPAIDGNVPGFLLRANRERTGKTYLARTLNVGISGDEPPLLQFGATEEEREKRITSELLRGRTAAVLDNLPAGESIDSGALAMLLTARTWTGRILGKSRTATLPNGLTLILTGNNIGASGEIAQRLVPCHLESRSADPQAETGFPHEDPVAYARGRRRDVLRAILGLVEDFRERGCPPYRGVAFGGFEAWTRTVGGILAQAGCVNFLANLREWQDSADEFGADAAGLLGDWYREELAGAAREVSAAVPAKSILQRAERLELFARYRQGGTAAAQSFTFSKRVLGVIVDRVVRASTAVGEQPLGVNLALRRSSSGSNSLFRIEVVR